MSYNNFFTSYRLSIKKNKHLAIIPDDQEAFRIVKTLAEIMVLNPIPYNISVDQNEEWKEIHVVSNNKSSKAIIESYKQNVIICRLPPPENNNSLIIDVSVIGLAIARSQLSSGGVLVHGALVQVPSYLGGGGILLAGSGSVGKTTAANRIPSPWSALADDTSFIIPSGNGHYQVHPWPTWSRLLNLENQNPLEKNTWEIQSSLKLRAIYFLYQADENFIEPLSLITAASYLFETIHQVSSVMIERLTSDEIREIYKMKLFNVRSIIQSIPAYTLHLTLNGPFWEKIEKNLTTHSFTSKHPSINSDQQELIDLDENKSDGNISSQNPIMLSYAGPSMNPILRYPDVLEIIPYTKNSLKIGDIICFRQPENIQTTVHRIVGFTSAGIITRGDNNSQEDPSLPKPENLIGQVTAAWRYGKRRKISGGFKGRLISRYIRFCLSTNRLFSKPLHKIYRTLYSNEISQCLLSNLFHFKVFAFKRKHNRSIFKIMIKNRVVGRYNFQEKNWMINRPWRLFINESKLPDID